VGRLELVAPGHGPVTVSLNGVDLAIVGQITEGLRQPPLGPGVGGEPLVEDTQRRLQPRIVEIAIENRQISRHHQPLVGKHPGREAGDIEGFVLGADGLFSTAPGHIEMTLETGLVHSLRRIDEDLAEQRKALQRLFATGGIVGGNGAPAGHLQPFRGELLLQPGAGPLGQLRLTAEKDNTAPRLPPPA